MNFINGLSERHECGNDCPGAGAEDEVEVLDERSSDKRLYFLQDPQRVEPFSATSIERQHAT
jgi:hypothetical protein